MCIGWDPIAVQKTFVVQKTPEDRISANSNSNSVI